MRTLPIEMPLEQITNFCRGKPIARLSLFGSVLREDFTPESDVDFLVEFLPGAAVGMFELSRMEAELAGLVRRNVDLRTPLELSPRFRDQVLSQADPVYVKNQ